MPRLATRLATTAALGLLAAAPGQAQQSWESELADEILIMEDCEVNFLTQVIEREVDGRAVILAKVHCTDGRAFDASRSDRFATFDFSLCEPEGEPAAC